MVRNLSLFPPAESLRAADSPKPRRVISTVRVPASFLAQAVRNHLDGLEVHIFLIGKYNPEQAFLGHGVAGLGNQSLKHGLFARSQFQRIVFDVERTGLTLEAQVAAADGSFLVAVDASRQSADPCFEFVEVERFGQVVIAAGVSTRQSGRRPKNGR